MIYFTALEARNEKNVKGPNCHHHLSSFGCHFWHPFSAGATQPLLLLLVLTLIAALEMDTQGGIGCTW